MKIYVGTSSGCYCSASSIFHKTCSPSQSSCTSYNGISSQAVTRWRGSVLCVRTATSTSTTAKGRPTIQSTTQEKCPTSFYACPSFRNLTESNTIKCVPNDELCPVSSVKFSETRLQDYNCTLLPNTLVKTRTNISYLCIAREGTATSSLLELTIQINDVCTEYTGNDRPRKPDDLRYGTNGYLCGTTNLFFKTVDRLSESNMYLDNVGSISATYVDTLITPVSTNDYQVSARFGITVNFFVL